MRLARPGMRALVIRDLPNGDQAGALAMAGPYAAGVFAGTATLVIGPAPLPVPRCTITTVYAWGSLTNDSLGLIVVPRTVGCLSAAA